MPVQTETRPSVYATVRQLAGAPVEFDRRPRPRLCQRAGRLAAAGGTRAAIGRRVAQRPGRSVRRRPGAGAGRGAESPDAGGQAGVLPPHRRRLHARRERFARRGRGLARRSHPRPCRRPVRCRRAAAAGTAAPHEPGARRHRRAGRIAPGDPRRCCVQQPELAPLDSDLRHLFASWFNRGFLDLRRIDWNTPAAVLEKLLVYEAVHEIDGLDRSAPPARRRTAAVSRSSIPRCRASR